MIWANEIVDWKFVNMDWIDELCELFVFDGLGGQAIEGDREK